jgi:hypothetical protein
VPIGFFGATIGILSGVEELGRMAAQAEGAQAPNAVGQDIIYDEEGYDRIAPQEYLFSGIVRKLAKPKAALIGPVKCRSLYKELGGVAPSKRLLLIRSKTDIKSMPREDNGSLFERDLATILGTKRVASLRIFVGQVCEETHCEYGGPRGLKKASKTEILTWICEQDGAIRDRICTFAAEQIPGNRNRP